VWLNRSKESLTLDVKKPAGKAVLDELLTDADVLVQNLAPGAAGRLGIDAASLAERYPRLIPCSISGYGSDGPWADRKAYDLLVQCETGLVSLTGSPEEVAKVGVSVAGMYAYSGILTALYRRATTGHISAVEVSLFEALAEWMGSPAYYTRYGGRQPARVTHRDALNTVITARFAALDTTTALGLLDKAGVANARMNSVQQFLGHPHRPGPGDEPRPRTRRTHHTHPASPRPHRHLDRRVARRPRHLTPKEA
jgi:itaconate CoA-transferase